MRLAIGQPAAHRRPHSGRDIGIDRIHIEAHVNEAGSGDVGERLADRALHAEAIEIAHREHLHVLVSQQLALTVVQ